MFIKETEIGFEINSPRFFFFFGKKGSSFESLKSHYPQYEFARVKQVHGDTIVDRTNDNQDNVPEADGQFTTEKNQAMVVATADCIPVLLVHPPTQIVMALHSGWRGVAKRIIPRGIEIMKKRNAPTQEIFVVIGPHIQGPSFEVGTDVKDTLMNSVSNSSETETLVCRPGDEGKFFVDLNTLAKIQIAEFNIPQDQVFSLHVDTFKDPKFHSFRREKEQAGRQLSFVVRR